MKHETFKQAAIGEAFEMIESSILPSLTMLVDSATAAEPGVDAVRRADELRALARQLESLTALLQDRLQADQTIPEPFKTEE